MKSKYFENISAYDLADYLNLSYPHNHIIFYTKYEKEKIILANRNLVNKELVIFIEVDKLVSNGEKKEIGLLDYSLSDLLDFDVYFESDLNFIYQEIDEKKYNDSVIFFTNLFKGREGASFLFDFYNLLGHKTDYAGGILNEDNSVLYNDNNSKTFFIVLNFKRNIYSRFEYRFWKDYTNRFFITDVTKNGVSYINLLNSYKFLKKLFEVNNSIDLKKNIINYSFKFKSMKNIIYFAKPEIDTLISEEILFDVPVYPYQTSNLVKFDFLEYCSFVKKFMQLKILDKGFLLISNHLIDLYGNVDKKEMKHKPNITGPCIDISVLQDDEGIPYMTNSIIHYIGLK